MKKNIKVFFWAMFCVCLMQHWIYNLVLTSAEGGIKNSPTPADYYINIKGLPCFFIFATLFSGPAFFSVVTPAFSCYF